MLGFGKKPPMPPQKLVEVEIVKRQDIQQTVRLLGVIHPKHTTVLVSKGTGMLDAIVPTGQRITKGTLIAKIDNPDVEKNLQLSLAAADLAKTQFERFNPLLKSGFVSTKEVEEKKQVWIDAQKELSKTKIELDNLRFYAPFDGIIGAYKMREGAQVNPAVPVVTMYDPASLVVDVDIPCSHLTSLHEGQPVQVLGKPYVLSHLQKMLDEDTHMCPADVDIVCEDCLMGATVAVDLVVAERKGVVVIPYSALFLKEGKNYVYIVSHGKVERLPVTLGLHQKDRIEITRGIEPLQELIIKGQERLFPGMAVEVFRPELLPITP